MVSQVITKTEKAIAFLKAGDFKSALKIAKDFRIGVSKKQTNDMQMAYECMVYPDFYRQLGKDIEQVKANGITVLRQLLKVS